MLPKGKEVFVSTSPSLFTFFFGSGMGASAFQDEMLQRRRPHPYIPFLRKRDRNSFCLSRGEKVKGEKEVFGADSDHQLILWEFMQQEGKDLLNEVVKGLTCEG